MAGREPLGLVPARTSVSRSRAPSTSSTPSRALAPALALAFAIAFTTASIGCKYDPHPADGTLRCGPNNECPDGYTCVPPGLCWSSSGGGPTSLVGCDGHTKIAVNAQVVRSCILDLGCSPFQANSTISDCVTLNVQASVSGQHCTLGAKTCADFQKCVGFGFAGSDLCANRSGGYCNGNQAVNCDSSGTSDFFDCTVAGGTCVVSGTGAAAIADCRVVSSCSDTDGNTHCNGNISYSCVGGVGFGTSCGSDSFCNTDDGSCLLSGGHCAADSDICNGQVDEFCNGMHFFKYDCASVGLGCATAAPSSGNWCLAPGCTFADYQASTCSESCNGANLTFCYGGVPYTVDCRSYGFASCADGLSTPNGGSYAKCTN